jgi:hypothetical protein
MSLLALALGMAVVADPFDVTWEAPPGCGSADAVSMRAAEVLGEALERGERFAPVVAHGRVSPPRDGTWRLELSYRAADANDVRTFEAADCDDLVEGAALVLAVAATPLPAPEPPPPPPAPPIATPSPPEQRAEPARVRLGAALRGEAILVSRLLGPAWPSIGGTIALRYRALRVELGGMHVFARRYVQRDEDFAVGAAISLSAATLRGCGRPTAARGRIEFPICAGALLGAATARGVGDLEARRTRSQPWIAVLAGPGIAIPIHPRFAISLSVDAMVSVLRPGFRVESLSPELYRVGLVSVRAWLGFEVRLP